MSLREINEQIERELSMPEPAFVVRIWIDEQGQVQSERVPNVRMVEGIADASRRAAA
jgi:hypothetical protein